MKKKRIPAWAEICGRVSRKHVWVKTPVFPNTILTLPDSKLPYGMKEAAYVDIEVDPDSLYNDGVHYKADLKIVRDRTEEGPG